MLPVIPRIFVALLISVSPVFGRGPVPEVFGKSAILFDANTGEVLYKKNDTMQTPIASTQKLLTSLIIIQSGNLQGI